MDDVISLSSDESDVEIVAVCSRTLSDAEPLSAVRVDVEDVSVNLLPVFIDLTEPQRCFPHIQLCHRPESNSEAVVDLTELDERNPETESLPPDCQTNEGSAVSDISNKDDLSQRTTSSKDATLLDPVQDTVPKSLQRMSPQQNSDAHPCHQKPVVKLMRLSFLEFHAAQQTASRFSVNLAKGCAQLSLCPGELSIICKTEHSLTDLRTSTPSNVQMMEPALSYASAVNVPDPDVEMDQYENNKTITRTTLQSQESQDPQSCAEPFCLERRASPDNNSVQTKKADCSSFSPPRSPEDNNNSDVHCSELEQLGKKAVSHQSPSSGQSRPPSPVRLCSPELFNLDSLSTSIHVKSTVDLPPPCEMQETEMDPGGQSEIMPCSTDTYENDSLVSILWPDEIDDEDMSEERSFDGDFRAVKGDDRHYVCPVALKRCMAQTTHDLFGVDDDNVGGPEVLSRQTLCQVYTTIQENYPEGTLQQLFYLLQPGCYLPKDITTHLLHGILLSHQCSQYQCVQAFNLLMRAQRYHMADKNTIPWDWELLTSVIENQENTKKHRREIVCMLLEYIIQTLEDDFHAKHCASALHHSIAKATLSCDEHFSQVRDVIKWLFSVITKSTECKESNTERDDHIRMVTVFQRMLFLALEVDRSPARSSAKLSLELFHMLISNVSLRAHRLLLLETLQSKQLKCKLLEHLLEYACPEKNPLPMSLGLLLHFLKNSTPVPDPSDGTERSKKWDELIQLFWMLLISYSTAMKGYLCSSKMDQRSKVSTLVFKPEDVISVPDVQEAVDAFLSRSRADLGQELPPHVGESLSYLQDHLYDACQR